MRKYKEYIYAGEPVPELDVQEHAEFFTLMQKAVLYSLEKRNLLSKSQRDRCLAEINNPI